MEKGRTGLAWVLSIIVAVCIVSSACAFYYGYQLGSERVDDAADDDASPSIDNGDLDLYPTQPTDEQDKDRLEELKNLTFPANFELPDEVTEPIPVLSLERPVIDSSNAADILSKYGMLHVDESSDVFEGASWYSVRNPTNYTVVRFFDAEIEYSADDPLPEGATETEIASNDLLYGRDGVREIAIDFLREHGLYDLCTGEWERFQDGGAHVGTNCTTGERVIYDYLFSFVPVFDGRPMIEPEGPRILVTISPNGEITHLRVNLRETNFSEERVYPKYPDPFAALEFVNRNIHYFFLCCGPMDVSNVRPGYMLDPKDDSRGIPCWIIYIGGSTYLNV